MPKRRIVLPLDVPTLDEAASLAGKLADEVGVLKIGLELFTALGPSIIRIGRDLKLDVFLDLKLHDIPETVERAVRSASKHGVKYLTVHASGGPAMLKQAVIAASENGIRLLAVTVLTSLDDQDLKAVGISRLVGDQVVGLARMAWDVGIRGFVCSPKEVSSLRQILGPDAFLVVPGVRPIGSNAGDQKRVATPSSAIRDGADLLVVGRPIRDAADPVAAARQIATEIGVALSSHG